ncbi:RING-H2 finger protein ATL74 [Acorus calamus]|uniref:RING-H2 finger protein ATL74 n=1 Tax=Acorus calamus TaxID=4465 RepID=A0AAV9CDH1_ACOCL|nr:RING-H2 finger protein ATL74 [Acorus calamus]
MKNLIHRRFLLDPLTDSPPATSHDNGTGPRQSSGADSTFDTNMVIILAALLCALVCALGINSLVRCALRFVGSRRAPSDGAARTGLKKRALRKIPVAVYGAAAEGPAAGMMTGTECPICLGEFYDGEKVRVLPECNHGFHVGCIDEWLAGQSSCPTCRHSVVEVKGGASRGGGGEVVVGVDSNLYLMDVHNTISRPSSGADSNLATNLVIILAGILLAVVCVLVRCALEGGGRTGLKKRALRKIPVAVYGAAGLMTGTECPICLGEFHEGEKLRVLPECNHGFHVECIDEWLAGRSSCPMCRHSVLEVKGAPSAKMAGSSRGGEGEVVVGVDRGS